jgi:CRISPR-associated helicase Cas3
MGPIEIEGYRFDRVTYPGWKDLKIPIYQHQASVMDSYESGKNILLCTKTGSGKTAAALFPIIKNAESSIFVYPTNALIKNQLINIYKTLTKVLHKKVHIGNFSLAYSDMESLPANEADICIHLVNREVLESCANRGSIIQEILHDLSNQTLILTNPDTLFAILSMAYREHLNVVRALSRYKSIVIDEFHMYYGIQLANIVFMLKFAEKLLPNTFKKKIFLSATPSNEIANLLQKFFAVEQPETISEYEKVDSYPAIQAVQLNPYLLINELNYGEIINLIGDLMDDIKMLRNKFVNNNEYVPCVIIVNSVIDAIHIEEEILKKYPKLTLSPYHGLMSKFERKIGKCHIVVGTNAIEVGIDFQCSYLIFDAGDASSFLQRFGRIGRHSLDNSKPIAYAFIPQNFYRYLDEHKIERLTRDNLESIVKDIYPTYSSFCSFVSSDYGILQAHVFIQKLKNLLIKWKSLPERAISLMDSYIDEIYGLIGIDEIRKRKIEKRLLNKLWFRSYINKISFRSTLPTIMVYDKSEERKGRTPFYEATITDILAKGTPAIPLQNPKGTFYSVIKKFNLGFNVFFDEDTVMVLVDNYDYSYSLRFNTVKEHQLYAPFLCDNSDIFVSRKGHNLNLSELLNGHIAMFIGSESYFLTDWRIKKFRTEHEGKYIVFDGDVLLYLSILDKADVLPTLQFISEKGSNIL